MNSKSPRVLVEPSDYVLRNIGDMAMLYTATERLRALLPDATIQVLTDEPNALQTFCPSAVPLPARGRRLWLGHDRFRAVLRRVLPLRFADAIRSWAPASLTNSVERWLFGNRDARAQREEFLRAVKECDLLVVAGMGGITDSFPEYATGVLKTMELAVRSERRIAMVGQGLGPLHNRQLRARAASILPHLELIALREKRAGKPLLLALGVDPARVIVTGDDAMQLSYDLRVGKLGRGIGINLRLSGYSAVSEDAAAQMGQLLSQVAETLSASLIPVPISRVDGEADVDSLRVMLPNEEFELAAAADISLPKDLIRQIQRCRVVVTGSYHAGVFALANGIPTIGIAGSSYYEDKFYGLADMFGEGCEVLTLSHENFLSDLSNSVSRLWSTAESLRSHLLKAAEAQIAASHVAYRKVAKLAIDDPRATTR